MKGDLIFPTSNAVAFYWSYFRFKMWSLAKKFIQLRTQKILNQFFNIKKSNLCHCEYCYTTFSRSWVKRWSKLMFKAVLCTCICDKNFSQKWQFVIFSSVLPGRFYNFGTILSAFFLTMIILIFSTCKEH